MDANKAIITDPHTSQLEYQQQHQQHEIQDHRHHHYHHHPPPPQQQQHQVSHGMMQSSPSSSITANNFLSKDGGGGGGGGGGAYDLGELDQALFLYLDGHDHTVQDQKQNSGMRPPTLNIFPSQPMHVDPSPKVNMGLASPRASGSKRPPEPSVELASARNDVASAPPEPPKTNVKTLRRLAQNREAARKSRLRKKAYIQQLETSRIKLSQLEQELQRARSQGMFLGGAAVLGGEQGLPVGISNISADATVFDMEYARWLEEHHRLMCELRAAVQEHLPENELQLFVDNTLAHYNEMINLKSMVAKSDVFHLVSGMWKTPAERCFMWMGGFRPSELIKVILNHIEPLTEQQLLGICGLQESTQQTEEALSRGLEALNQSLSETIASDSLISPPNMANYMGQMADAMSKLSALEGFVRQADHLRHRTLHRLHRILTTRQAARCLLAIAEYSHRLRALSSLWLSRPRQE
ncbi:bZIP transcription factor TGA10 isoform X2 [Rhodamnia argentea]|uniref:BZIP transcription factor TGA10 isoform X2 n=1 Tax=Rhodamnia argentea TaxID=178133 RepID=A0A8B8N690_9MYRT|nr:bZIP transcription factor TGA10 isoform X2 [Rhodamnia argentea]